MVCITTTPRDLTGAGKLVRGQAMGEEGEKWGISGEEVIVAVVHTGFYK